jgi:hypothetical protein
MKELTKSVFSYSLAMTFFWFKQVDNLLSSTPPGEAKAPAIKSIDSLTSATAAQFGGTLKDAFHAADNLQRGLVELAFDVMFPLAGSFLNSRDSRDLAGAPSAAEPRLWTEVVVDRVYDTEPGPEPVSPLGRLA